jgi:ribonuclease HIII
MSSTQKTLHTCPLTPEQASRLRTLLAERGWEFSERPYTQYFAQKEKLTLAVYEKGPKLVLQGKGAAEFVEFTLEPEVLGQAQLGYEEVHSPEMFSPHFGIDESGKGDFFGPLVIAGCYVDPAIARSFREAGIQDSKRIGSDQRIRDLAKMIKQTPGATRNVVMIGPERYNALYAKFGNLNRLLAWGHARVIENLLEQRPDCPRALSDQFANPSLIQRALLERGRGIALEQRTKAESDPAVAAASILARECFIDWLRAQQKKHGCELPRGASAAVKATARQLAEQHGPAILRDVAKVHFKTASEIAPELYPRKDDGEERWFSAREKSSKP